MLTLVSCHFIAFSKFRIIVVDWTIFIMFTKKAYTDNIRILYSRYCDRGTLQFRLNSWSSSVLNCQTFSNHDGQYFGSLWIIIHRELVIYNLFQDHFNLMFQNYISECALFTRFCFLLSTHCEPLRILVLLEQFSVIQCSQECMRYWYREEHSRNKHVLIQPNMTSWFWIDL
jgi:hypothetical protein